MQTTLTNITTAFRSAGVLMTGTGLIVWAFGGPSYERYALISGAVGLVFVIGAVAISHFFGKRS